jgi:hypothetical protein
MSAACRPPPRHRAVAGRYRHRGIRTLVSAWLRMGPAAPPRPPSRFWFVRPPG